MKETLNMLRRRLGPRLGRGETDAVIGLMFHSLLGWNRVDMLMHDDEELTPYIRGKIADMLARLEKGEPVQYVTGEAYFYGTFFKVDPRVLIPRPETAELVDMIVSRFSEASDLRVLDLCTGSGCVAIALARNLRFPEVVGVDISGGALEVAEENARMLSASNVTFAKHDVLTWRPGGADFDIVVANPPYVLDSERADMEPTVVEWEPAQALFVPDADPLRYYRAIADIALGALKPGGALYLEINPLESQALVSLLEKSGLTDVETVRDIHGRNRFIICRRPG